MAFDLGVEVLVLLLRNLIPLGVFDPEEACEPLGGLLKEPLVELQLLVRCKRKRVGDLHLHDVAAPVVVGERAVIEGHEKRVQPFLNVVRVLPIEVFLGGGGGDVFAVSVQIVGHSLVLLMVGFSSQLARLLADARRVKCDEQCSLYPPE